MGSYSAEIQECLESAKDQFRLSLCSLDAMPTSLESYDRARDAIRAEAIHLNIHSMWYCCHLSSLHSLTRSADLVIDNHMIQLVRYLLHFCLTFSFINALGTG